MLNRDNLNNILNSLSLINRNNGMGIPKQILNHLTNIPFNIIDTDQDGKIVYHEFKEYFENSIGGGLDDDVLYGIFDTIDGNHDGWTYF